MTAPTGRETSVSPCSSCAPWTSAVADGHQLFLEVGAHPALTPSIREYAALNKVDLTVVSNARAGDRRVQDAALGRSRVSTSRAATSTGRRSTASPRRCFRSLAIRGSGRRTGTNPRRRCEARVGGPAAGLAGYRLDMHEPVWERRHQQQVLALSRRPRGAEACAASRFRLRRRGVESAAGDRTRRDAGGCRRLAVQEAARARPQ